MRVFRRCFQLLLLSVAVLVVACNTGDPTNPDPSKVDPATMVPPALGSSFIYEMVDVDTITGFEVDSTRTTYTMYVSQVGMEYEGRTNVTEFMNVHGTDSNTSHCIYEADGSVSYILHNALRGKEIWYRVPIAGETHSSGYNSDVARIQTDQCEYSDVTATERVEVERTGTSEESVLSKVFAVVLLKENRTSTTLRNGYSYGAYSPVSTWSFAPNLGVSLSGESEGKVKINGKVTWSYSRKSKLISYKLE